jgi:hypothetical protein
MKGVEIMWNSYGNWAIRQAFGFPVILNLTQTFKIEPGYTVKGIIDYVLLNNPSLFKKMKDKLIKWLLKESN